MIIFVFFFQAEDGIRDDLVTGVQTCALPIAEREMHGQHPAARLLAEFGNRRVPVLGLRETALDILAGEATLRDEDWHIEPPFARACLADYKRTQLVDFFRDERADFSVLSCS